MADAAEPQDTAPAARSRLPLLVGVAAALAFGGAAFYASYSGLILGGDTAMSNASPGEHGAAGGEENASSGIAFVAMDPVVVSLGTIDRNQHLRFAAQLEVPADRAEEVTHLLPRILDVLNGYLRAVDVAELEDPTALIRLRAQMLRRIQIVTGEGRVRDLLITEFVMN